MFEDTNFISVAPWERQLADSLGLHVVASRFIVSFFASTAAHALWRKIPSVTGRHLHSFAVGLLAVYYPFGNGCIHLLTPTLLTYLFINRVQRHCGTLTWMVAFPYLIVCHMVKASGISWKSGAMDFTGAQMMLTLRLIALAVCCQDGAISEQGLRRHAIANRILRVPSFLEFLGYTFGCGNLLAGPVYEFAEYREYVERIGPYAEPLVAPWAPGFLRLVKAVAFMVAYSSLTPKFPPKLLEDAWFTSQRYHIRWLSMMVVALIYRFKYYFVWALAESGLIFSGLCYNGRDEHGKPKWDKYINCRIRNIESCTSASLFATNWNVATGNWLRHYVYERLTPPHKKPTFLTLLITQLISGVWHGMYSGYVLFFSGLAFFFESSRVIYRYERAAPSWVAAFPPWMLVKWLYTMTTLNYLAVAFVVLTFGETLHVWKSLHYVGHVMMCTIIIFGWTIPAAPRRPVTDVKTGNNGNGVVHADGLAGTNHSVLHTDPSVKHEKAH